MPEGPEVAILSEELNSYFKKHKNDYILNCTFFVDKSRFLDNHYFSQNGTFAQFKSDIEKHHYRLGSVRSKGKFLLFTFLRIDNPNDKWYLMSTLALAGYWEINDQFEENSANKLYKPKKKKIIMTIKFTNNIELTYLDPRFGKMAWTKSKTIVKERLSKLGPDLLKDNLIYEDFAKTIKKYPKKNLLKLLVMEQNIFSGIGNYASAEILYLAQISPYRTVGSLSNDELINLFYCIRYVLKLSYFMQGGKKNYYPGIKLNSEDTKEFKFKVYGKKGKNAFDPFGNKVKADKIMGTRTTYWVPSIQK
jgi:formamidopyrimidine-DNA glycosylase